jgi:hypothetical protein
MSVTVLTARPLIRLSVKGLRKGLLTSWAFEPFYPLECLAMLADAFVVAEGASHLAFSF